MSLRTASCDASWPGLPWSGVDEFELAVPQVQQWGSSTTQSAAKESGTGRR